MTEPEVLKKVHRFLRAGRLGGSPGADVPEGGRKPQERTFSRLYTDAHASLVDIPELKPFQRFALDLGDRIVHPDLVGQFADGETLLAVEGKGAGGLTKGLAQALQYKEGFHLSFLAASTAAIGSSVERFARREGLGLMGVSDDVRVLHYPLPRQPWKAQWQSIRSQLDVAGEVMGHNTFHYNLPTHYLVWAIALRRGHWHSSAALKDSITGYSMPKNWKPALRGAQKLGIARISGKEARLTTTGEAVQDILDTTVEEWADVHAAAKRAPLVGHTPQAAAVLRLLLMRSPMTRLVVAGLRKRHNGRASLSQLAHACSALDYGRAMVLFFIPERLEPITNSRGRVEWDRLRAEHYRPTTSYQYKSILKHAGIIEDTGLGGSTVSPEDDLWELCSEARD